VDENASFEVPNDPDATAFRLYHASKLLSNNAAWSFWRNEKPHYSLVSIHPAFALGHNLVQSSPDEIGSNGVLWKLIMTGTFGRSVAGVHIQDVAEAHIKALNPDIPDGAKYLLVGKPITWKEVAQIVSRDYPNVAIKISMEAEGGTMPCDNTKTEQELGMKWRSWEQMIHEVMDQQLGLVKESTI
jgi:nucleoside-diphosphate-sugar epimerase